MKKFAVFYSELSQALALKSFEGVMDKSSLKRVFNANSMKEAVNMVPEIHKEIEDNDRLSVIIVDHLEEPYFTSVRKSLNEYQRIVQGTIDIINCPDLKDIDIICNDEGKTLKLPLNRGLTYDHELYDVVAGPMILTRSGKEGEIKGLDQEDLFRCYEHFKYPELFLLNDEKGEVEVIDCSTEMARIMKLNLIPNVTIK